MKTELYNKIFERMDKLGAIRLCEIQHASMTHEPYKDAPVLSDCVLCMVDNLQIYHRSAGLENLVFGWDLSKPYLIDQSDELGDKLLELIKP